MAEGVDLSILETVEIVTDELRELTEYIGDEDFTYVVKMVLKLISKPDVPAEYIEQLIVKTQALAMKMGLMALTYRTLRKSGVPERTKKDAYYTCREGLERLVDALKFVAKDKLSKQQRGY